MNLYNCISTKNRALLFLMSLFFYCSMGVNAENHAPAISSTSCTVKVEAKKSFSVILPLVITDEDNDKVSFSFSNIQTTDGGSDVACYTSGNCIKMTGTANSNFTVTFSLHMCDEHDECVDKEISVNVKTYSSSDSKAYSTNIKVDDDPVELVYGETLGDIPYKVWYENLSGQTKYITDEGTIYVCLADNTPYALTDVLPAGSYSLQLIFLPTSSDYYVSTKTVSCTVSARPITLLSASASKYYDGTALSAHSVDVKEGSLGFVGSDQFVYSNFASIIDEGSTVNTFDYSAAAGTDASNYSVTREYGTLTVNPALTAIDITIELDETSFTYDGAEHKPNVVVKSGETVISADEYSLTWSDDLVNAGSKSVTVNDADGGTYVFSSKSATFKINTKTLTNSDIYTDYEPLYYNGEKQLPDIVVTLAEDETVVVPSSEYKLTCATCVDAGLYSVKLSNATGGNYTFSGSITRPIFILARPVTIKSADGEWTYDGEIHKAESVEIVSGSFIGTDGLEYSRFAEVKNAGEYDNYYQYDFTGSTVEANYDIDYQEGKLVINKKLLSADDYEIVFTSTSAFTYDGNEKKPSVSVKLGDGTYLPESQYSVSYVDNIHAGTASVVISNSGLSTANYSIESKSKNFTISPAKLVFTTLSKTFTYDGNEHFYSNAALTSGSFATGDGLKYPGYVNYTTITDVGSVDNKLEVLLSDATLASDYDIRYIYGTLTVEPKLLSDYTIVVTGDVDPYNGTEHKPDVEVYVDGLLISDDEYSVEYSNNINAGDATVTVSNVVKGNYTFADKSETFYIEPATLKLVSNSNTWVYDGDEHSEPTVTAVGYVGDEELKYDFFPTITDAGTVKNSFKYTSNTENGTDVNNYSITYKYGTLTVEPRPIYPLTEDTPDGTDPNSLYTASLNADNFTYNGEYRVPALVIFVNGNVLSTAEYDTTLSGNLNAGIATVAIRNAEGGNYLLAGYDVNFNIGAKSLSLTSGSGEWVYDGAAHSNESVSGTEDFVAGEGADFYDFASVTNVGNVENTFSMAANVGTLLSNYNITVNNGSLVINPRTLSPLTDDVTEGTDLNNYYSVVINSENKNFVYDGTYQTPSFAVMVNGELLPASEYDTTCVNNQNAGTASVNVSDADGGNYTLEPSVVNFEISKKSLQLSSDDGSWVYDGNEHKNESVLGADEFAAGEGVSLSNFAAITDAGSVQNTFYYEANEGTLLSNYDISVAYGTLNVTPRPIEPVVDYTVEISDGLIYNGQCQTPDFRIMLDGDVIDPSEYDTSVVNNKNAGVATINIYNREGGNYELAAYSVNFDIAKKSVSLTSGSAEWSYDGEKHMLKEVAGTDAFVAGEGITLYGFPAITDVGEKVNSFSYVALSGTNLGNYDISPIYGTLTVTPRIVEPVAENESDVVDPLSVYSIKIEDEAFVYDGDYQVPSLSLYVNGMRVDESEYDTTIENNLNAGTAVVYITDKTGGNYTIVGGNQSFVISPKSVTLTSSSDSWTYDGFSHSSEMVSGAEAFVAGQGVVFSEFASITNAGSVDNVFGYVASEGTLLSNYDITPVYGVLTVEPRNISALTDDESGSVDLSSVYSVNLSDDGLVYNGQNQNPTLQLYVNGVLLDGAEYDTVCYNNRNAGTATLCISNKEGGNYNVNHYCLTFNIQPKAVTLVSADAEWVYDGAAHSKTVVDGTEHFVTGEGIEFYNFAKITDADTVANSFDYYPLEGTLLSNYDLTVVSGNLIVTPKYVYPLADGEVDLESAYTVSLTDGEYTYNGEFHVPSLSLLVNGVELSQSEYDTVCVDNKYAGTATVLIKNRLGGNFVVGDYETHFAINPKQIELLWNDSLFVYDGNAKEVTASLLGIVDGDDVNVISYSGNTNTEAGDYRVDDVVIDNSNYTLGNVEKEWRIVANADVQITVLTDDYVYDKTAKTPSVLVTCGDVVVPTSEYEVSYSNNIEAGQATVSVGNIDGNYDVPSFSSQYLIQKKQLSVVWSDSVFMYDGESKTVSPTVNGVYDGDRDGLNFTLAGETAVGAADYEAVISMDVNNNYVLGPDSVLIWHIKATEVGNGEYSIAIPDDAYTYNGDSINPDVDVMMNGVVVDKAEFVVEFVNNVNAGVAIVRISDAEGGNYVFAGADTSFVINPVELTVQSDSGVFYYDGRPHSNQSVAITSGQLVGDDKLDFNQFSEFTEVGTYENQFSVVAVGSTTLSNYNLRLGFGTIVINDIPTFNVVVADGDYVYNGAEQKPDVEVTSTPSADYPYELVYVDNVDAGTASVLLTKVGDTAAVLATAHFEIKPAVANLSWGNSVFTYDGTTKLMEVWANGLEGDSLAVDSVSNGSASAAGEYMAVVLTLNNKNYCLPSDSSHLWTILKSESVTVSGLEAVAETEADKADGRIRGLELGMEIRNEAQSEYSVVADLDTVLSPGNYYVRWAESENYLASADTLIVIASASPTYSVDSILVDRFGYCQMSDAVFCFVTSGKGRPAEFRILCSDSAKSAGFADTEFEQLATDGQFSVSVPDCAAGVYALKVQFRDSEGKVSDLYDLEVEVNLSSEYITDIWSDVISAVNVDNIFTGYQWYHNDVKLDNENKPYYCEKGGLTGSYYLEVTIADGSVMQQLHTCRKYFADAEAPLSITAYPNPTADCATITLGYDDGSEHQLSVINTVGKVVFSVSFVGKSAVVNFANMVASTYIVSVDGMEIKVIKY